MKKFTAQKIRNLLIKKGVDPSVVDELDPRRKSISLKAKQVKEAERRINEEGIVVIRKTSTGNIEFVSKKYVTLTARRPFEHPEMRARNSSQALKKLEMAPVNGAVAHV